MDRIKLGCEFVYLLANKPYKTIEDCIKHLNESELFSSDEKKKIRNKLKTFKSENWIPVDFDKPKEVSVIVFDTNEGVKGSEYFNGYFYKPSDRDDFIFKNVTHWRYFPDTPDKIKNQVDCDKCVNKFTNPFDQEFCREDFDILNNKDCKGKKFKLI